MEIKITEKDIEKALPKILEGLSKYNFIQSEVLKRDIRKDTELQRRFNAFYRVRRGIDERKVMYELIFKKEANIKNVLEKLYNVSGNIEKSYASKIVATNDPTKPVIDSIVLGNINVHRSFKSIDEVTVFYKELEVLYKKYLKTNEGRYLVKKFDEYYSKNKITSIKKLDFILWQIR